VPGEPIAHGRVEVVPLGGAPSFAAPWNLLVRILDLVVGPEGTPDRGAATADGGIDGVSPAIARLRGEVRRLAKTRLTVLVLGETGSGKEMVAREIHRLSGRRGELVSVNIAAIPSNLLEAELFGSVKGAFTGADRSRRGLIPAADGGTLFLDEVGDLDPALQVKLLRFLESGEVRPVGADQSRIVDVRVVCATHRDLQRLIDQGRFRPDLFYRIGIANVVVPPLRERPEDIPLLREIFERDAADRHGLQVSSWTGVAEETLRRHDWPGNVRELRHTVEVAMARAAGQAIRPGHLPIEVDRPAVRRRWDDALADFRRRLLADALTRHHGNRSAAARELGISRQALLYQLKALKMKS
jgi:transcriptional regulator with PAS, ATPase and Fis domain